MQFCHPGEETVLLSLCDNLLAPIANVANAYKASYVFSQQSANAGLGLPTFTDYIVGCALARWSSAWRPTSSPP